LLYLSNFDILDFMKQYVIDQLRLEDYRKLKGYLDGHYGDSGVEGLYWLPMDEDLMDSIQSKHTECQPFYFGIELDEQQMSAELLVRTRNKMRCACMGYAAPNQREWFIEKIDAILEELQVKT
jgi:hypothetical protein